MFSKRWSISVVCLVCVLSFAFPLYAKEVGKGEIPAEHLDKACKSLPWGVTVWDLPEAISELKADNKVLWVDTRPESFYQKGSIRGAVVMAYNKSGESGNELTKDKLLSAIKASGHAKVAFFCQGPECHRSYNAAYVAVTEWGLDPKNVIWFRDGYPVLFKEVKVKPALKRKAKTYITDEGMAQL